MPIKGSIMLKNRRYTRWQNVFRVWYNSDFAAVAIHCDDSKQAKYVRKSAADWRGYYGYLFWTHIEHDIVYLVKVDAIKNIAMEVKTSKEGAIYFYDTSETV